MVTRALANDAVAVIILGGSHDLTEAVRSVLGDRCEYLRVKQHAFSKYSSESKPRAIAGQPQVVTTHNGAAKPLAALVRTLLV
jgi:hypothetical protein